MEYGKNGEAAKCLECGDEILYGRTDRKFCSEECKNRFNNRKSRNSRVAKLRTLNALEKNHRILDRLLKAGMDSIEIILAKQMGFDPDYVTSFHSPGGIAEYCCFDIRYRMDGTMITGMSRMASFAPGDEN